MNHLFPSYVNVLRREMTSVDGMINQHWAQVGSMRCRLDLIFRRPGRDEAAYAIEAGRTPDRMGVLFCTSCSCQLLALDRIVCCSGPIHGSFEITMIPDEVPDMASIHHLEVSVREVSPLLLSETAL